MRFFKIPVAILLSTGLIAAQPAPRYEAPNTDACPQAERPPQAVTTSEAPLPGESPVAPLPTVEPRIPNCGVTAPEDFDLPVSTASAWLVFDIQTGEILAAKDPHGRYRPASIIKVLLALVALEELDPTAMHTVTAEDVSQEGSAVGLVEGVDYSIHDLLYGLMLASGNDAAHALASELGGDAATITAINELAVSLGTTDTYAASYQGLDAPGMSTSAYDMALMYRYAYRFPSFAQLLSNDYVELPAGEGETFQVWNDNMLYLSDPDSLGGKTGYTDDANHTFVGAKRYEDRSLGVVILDTTADLARPWMQAQALLDAAAEVESGIGFLEAPPGNEPQTSAAPTPPVTPTPVFQEMRPIHYLSVGVLALLVLGGLLAALDRRARHTPT